MSPFFNYLILEIEKLFKIKKAVSEFVIEFRRNGLTDFYGSFVCIG